MDWFGAEKSDWFRAKEPDWFDGAEELDLFGSDGLQFLWDGLGLSVLVAYLLWHVNFVDWCKYYLSRYLCYLQAKIYKKQHMDPVGTLYAVNIPSMLDDGLKRRVNSGVLSAQYEFFPLSMK